MAIRIQCSECTKRIVIDDAFAGGVCRCPFCSEIVMVPAGEGQASSERPESPGRPERPDSPERPAEPAGPSAPAQPKPAVNPATIPMARADRTMTYVMFAAVTVLAVAVVAGMMFAFANGPGISVSSGNTAANTSGAQGYDDPSAVANPFKAIAAGPGVAGNVAIASPVVYVLDGGDSMYDVFDYAVAVSGVSVGTLRPNDRFTAVISVNENVATNASTPPAPFEAAAAPPAISEPGKTAKALYLPGGWLPGSAKSEQAFLQWARDCQERDEAPRGQTDVLATLNAAVAIKPKTIIVFTLKDLTDNSGQLLPEAAAVAAKAKSGGISIVAIGLHKTEGVNDKIRTGLEKFAAASGGEARNYGRGQLDQWAFDFPGW